MWKKRNSGFTLVEFMIAGLIFILLIAAIFAVLTTGNTSWRMGEVRIELQQELRKGMMWITEELRQSAAARITGVPTDGIPRNTITFSIPQSGATGWDSDDVQYSLGGLNNEQLLREQAAVQRVLANHIVSFEVSRQDATPNIVEVALQAEETTIGGGTLNLGLNFQVTLRN